MERIETDAGKARLAQGEAALRDLLLAGLAGNERTYQQFLSELSAHLRAYLRRRLQQRPDDVEDLLQESLIAVHNQRHTYRQDQPLTAWVHAIARYKLADFWREHAAHGALHDPLDDAAELLSSADHDASEARRDLAQLMDELPERQRLPITHVKLEGRSVAEAARLTGMSESAIKVGVHRGLKALAARIRSRP